MDYKEFFSKNIPFPYFILDKRLKMKVHSNCVTDIFPANEFFVDFFDEPYQEKVKQFLRESISGEFIEVMMKGQNLFKRFYRIYKVII
jgi:hypothetical protein